MARMVPEGKKRHSTQETTKANQERFRPVSDRPASRIDVCARSARSQPKGCYTRLFQPPAESLAKSQEEKLINLGSGIRYDIERKCNLTPSVRYKYLDK